jgi:hypothetical protein
LISRDSPARAAWLPLTRSYRHIGPRVKKFIHSVPAWQENVETHGKTTGC